MSKLTAFYITGKSILGLHNRIRKLERQCLAYRREIQRQAGTIIEQSNHIDLIEYQLGQALAPRRGEDCLVTLARMEREAKI